MIPAPPSPYRTEQAGPGHHRIVPDYAASRAIAADMVARERAQASRPLWQRLADKLRARGQ